ncbi:uncharacterized protein LOC115444183 [Manduca sexta]|uniref:uncharacterized protein LOC115444183 n=1 Tax=Manduca sexta TaxID=7130 RepID=UPI00188E99F3|nr:uncharacterized protein LOC115444183 [Manduca sexta]
MWFHSCVGTMPRAGGAGMSGSAGASATAAAPGTAAAATGASAVSPLRVQVQGARLSSSCGTIDLPLELPPCVLLLQRCAPPAVPPAAVAPRPSCSYHLLPESHRGAPLHYPQRVPVCAVQEEADTTDACSTSSTAPSPSPRSDESLGSPEDDAAPDTLDHLDRDSAEDD